MTFGQGRGGDPVVATAGVPGGDEGAVRTPGAGGALPLFLTGLSGTPVVFDMASAPGPDPRPRRVAEERAGAETGGRPTIADALFSTAARTG